MQSVSQEICKFYQSDKCQKGEFCPYLHITGLSQEELNKHIKEKPKKQQMKHQMMQNQEYAGGQNQGVNTFPQQQQQIENRIICVAYNNKCCKYGDVCRNIHDIRQVKQTPDCTYFVQNRCTKGDDCPFIHDTKKLGQGQQYPPQQPTSMGQQFQQPAFKIGLQSLEDPSQQRNLMQNQRIGGFNQLQPQQPFQHQKPNYSYPPQQGQQQYQQQQLRGQNLPQQQAYGYGQQQFQQQPQKYNSSQGQYNSSQQMQSNNGSIPAQCKFFQLGKCTKGPQCPFQH